MGRKIIVSLIGLLIISLLIPSISLATYSNHDKENPADFTRCPDPGGTKVASYDEGWHWIVGESDLRWGSDNVYDIGEQRYVQCYCPTDDLKGIQTNWMPTSLVSDEKQEKLINKGWILVDGADFGLPNIQYLAKNSKFICKPKTDNNCHDWDIKNYPKPQSVNKLLKKLDFKIDKILN